MVEVTSCHGFIKVGSAVTLSDMEKFLTAVITLEPNSRTRIFVAVSLPNKSLTVIKVTLKNLITIAILDLKTLFVAYNQMGP